MVGMGSDRRRIRGSDPRGADPIPGSLEPPYGVQDPT